MKIGIAGPSNVNYVEEISKDARKIIAELAKKLAKEGHEIVVTPDKGSVSELFLKNI